MKRAVILSAILISLDQFLKFFFQYNFEGQKLLFLEKIGFTYVINPGIYISLNISELSILILQVSFVAILMIMLHAMKHLKAVINKDSLLIDLVFAFLATGLIGNLILDRMMFGYIRDYLILPMGIANLADFCGLIAFILFGIKIFYSAELRDYFFRGVKTQNFVEERK